MIVILIFFYLSYYHYDAVNVFLKYLFVNNKSQHLFILLT